ncbi:MAG: 16S rRNA (adenine(1518)-N(6)/adenine(1519)-N(6))-dimethyltransferase RsmA [Lachnospiraceae bacterium]|nr:16S rRNA (adenine(1518)-N(6)/adenine(1519)-N(6))-dimethyltransferase RsmA [Lachnospiraceae bacterium]
MKKQPYLGNSVHTIAVLKSYGISARKKYGQNFLIDESVLQAAVDAAGVTEDDCVLEIGPGIGTLTQYLAYAAGKVCAVEIDRSLLPILEDTLMGWSNVRVINADVLKLDLRELVMEENAGRPVKVVANLPYYITTPIIMQLFESGAPIKSMTVMVQKEVADRMQAKPGTKDYGALTLAVSYYADPSIVRIVHPSSFLPQPGVDSAVIHLERHEKPPVEVKDEKILMDLIRASFNQRRKKLTNGITNYAGFSYTKEQAEQAVADAGLDPQVRGEQLTLEQFAAIADRLAMY